MKWNWGTKIMLSFIGFVGFMGYLVVMSFQENIDLVTEDYYGEELKYGERMKEIRNANDLTEEVTVVMKDDHFIVTFPMIPDSAEVHFYRPNDQRFDKVYSLNKEKEIAVNKKELIPGKFTVKLSWSSVGKSYYQEQALFVK